MNVAVSIRASHLSGALRAHIQRRLHFSVARFADRLSRLSARVADAEGTSGERRYSCRLEAEVRPSTAPLVEEVVDRDLYTAIDVAADRLGRALRRTLAAGDGTRGTHGGARPQGTATGPSAAEAAAFPAARS